MSFFKKKSSDSERESCTHPTTEIGSQRIGKKLVAFEKCANKKCGVILRTLS